MMKPLNQSGYLTGHLLIAMPTMEDPRFAHSVVYICAHNEEGAMGLVVNKVLDTITFPEMLEQMEIASSGLVDHIPVHFGGPVEISRGFVLHSSDYLHDTTLAVADHISLTATVDILKALANGEGPRAALLTLGYAGWEAGQLDAEILDNVWLTAPADDELLFSPLVSGKWEKALGRLGISSAMLSGEAGHA